MPLDASAPVQATFRPWWIEPSCPLRERPGAQLVSLDELVPTGR
jgi:hypothetical protein